MGIPSIIITFIEKSRSVIARSGAKNAGLIIPLAMTNDNRTLKLAPGDDIPSSVSKYKDQIEQMLIGGSTQPKKAVIAFAGVDYADITDALEALADENASYIALSDSADTMATKVVTWIKAQRNAGKNVKAVLPNTAADNEGIINYVTESVSVGDKTYTAEQFCARIAGLLAGTPITESATYFVLTEATDCTRMTKEEMDTAIDDGKLILNYEDGKVRIVRAVNSFVTKSAEKGNQYKKIKLIDIMDTIRNDIKTTIKDEWIGKKANSYDNKCLLIAAIQNYFNDLIQQGVLSSASVEIDTSNNKKYLEENGVDTTELNSEEIKQANTGDKVFLIAQIKMNDAIEDVSLEINI